VNRRDFLSTSAVLFLGGLAGCTGDNEPVEQATPTANRPSKTDSTATATETDPHETDSPTTEEAVSTVRVQQGDGVVQVFRSESETLIAEETDARRAIQNAIQMVPSGGTVNVMSGTYRIEDRPIRVTEGVTLAGQGPGSTVFTLPDGLNQDAHTAVTVLSGDDGVTIRDLEIHGNEANNREIEPFPDSPHSHGLLIHESHGGPKPKRTTVENVHIHDTIRSNIVLGGVDCKVESATLANAATDHWLYFARAEQCTARDIRASGFAREGIVFSTPGQTAVDNTISGLVIEDAQRTPFNEASGFEKLEAIAPLSPIVFRPDGEGRGNTIKNVEIRPPKDNLSHRVRVLQPETTIEGLTITGPVGYTPNVIEIGNPATDVTVEGTTIADVTLDVQTDKTRFRGHSLFDIHGSNVNIEDVSIPQKVVDFFGVQIKALGGPISNCRIRDVEMRSGREALLVNGREHPVTELVVEEFTDVLDSGIVTKGDVKFASGP
jgi:hypothetical protein